MAKKYHPDTNKDDPQAKEKFAQLAEAYEVSLSFFCHIVFDSFDYVFVKTYSSFPFPEFRF